MDNIPIFLDSSCDILYEKDNDVFNEMESFSEMIRQYIYTSTTCNRCGVLYSHIKEERCWNCDAQFDGHNMLISDEIRLIAKDIAYDIDNHKDELRKMIEDASEKRIKYIVDNVDWQKVRINVWAR